MVPSELNVKGDVIIDFSHPALLDALLEYSSKTGTPVVYATTGYIDEQIDKIKEAAETSPVFFSWNMSMGINLLVELSKKAAAFLGDQFDIEILEKHHNLKKDAPSGTFPKGSGANCGRAVLLSCSQTVSMKYLTAKRNTYTTVTQYVKSVKRRRSA